MSAFAWSTALCADFSVACAASSDSRAAAPFFTISCWRLKFCCASRNFACAAVSAALLDASVAAALSRVFCCVLASISAMGSPVFTLSPIFTDSALISPDTCAPTLTDLNGWMEPLASTVCAMSPFFTSAVMYLIASASSGWARKCHQA